MHVSPHTVDERVRRVLKKLNVSNRIEAARILAVNGVFDDVTPYQPLTYQLIDLGEVPPAADAEAGRSSFRRFFNIGSPFPTASQPANRHGLMDRMICPILIAVATILAFSVIYSLFVGLGRVLPCFSNKCSGGEPVGFSSDGPRRGQGWASRIE